MNPTIRKLTLTLPLLLVAGLLALMFHTASGAASLQKDTSLSSHVLYVDVDATGPATGTSWYNAYTRLQDALWYAATLAPTSTVEIWVAEGVYYPDEGAGQTDDNIYSGFKLTDNLELYGGFAGDEILRSHRDWEVHVTVLSGDLDQNDTTDAHSVVTDTANIIGTNAYHVVTGHGVTVTARLDGFFITAGKAIDGGGGMFNFRGSPTLDNLIFSGNAAGDAGGGGMYNNDASSPRLTNVTFSGNSTDGDGGGMVNAGSNPTLDNVTFSGNSAKWGGGMSNVASSPTMNDVIFSGNEALGGGGMVNTYNSNPTLTNVTFSTNDAGPEGGGGMRNDASNPMLTDVTFSKNTADWAGGGMYNFKSSPTLENVVFADNFGDVEGGGMRNSSGSDPALSSVNFYGNAADNGGGMYNFESNPMLTDVSFSDNMAEHGAGMCNESGSSPTLTDVTFSGNAATDEGGGMYNFASSPTLTNVTFSGNAASGEHGGGMYNESGSSPTLDNVIFSGNAADNFGGGMYNFDDSNPILTNVSFSGNAAGNSGGGMFNHTSSSPTIRNSILWGNQDSGGTSVDAQIDNYNSTPVISYTLVQGYDAWGIDYLGSFDADPLFITPVDPNHAPTTEGNLRLQQGSPAVDAGDNSYVTVDTDLDGNGRIIGTTVDMGAYERLKPLFMPLVIRLSPVPPFRY